MDFSDPFDALFGLQSALDSYRSSDWLASGTSGGGAFPPVNVFRRGDTFVVVAEVPGIGKADINIEIKGSTIRLAGTKSIGYGDKASVHRRERLSGRFDRAITLPVEIDAERVKAECHDGILAIEVAPHEREKPRSIRID
jgi:HSP20 family protein